jgi:hypothetical protein
MEYYTYAYLREDGTPYYIGKGKDDRVYYRWRKGLKPPKDRSRIIFLKQNLTEEEAFKHEIYMIAVFGRKDLGTGILHNRTNGGEGNNGVIMSEETKRKISEANKGRIKSEEWRKNLSEAMKGKPKSEEHRRNNSEGQKGKTLSEETKRKMSGANKNPSEETRRKMSEAHNGSKWWNNGKETKLCIECPGEEWIRGRTLANNNNNFTSVEKVI